MRDRLGDLKLVSEDQEEGEFYSCIYEELDHMAVVFEEESTIDQVFKKVQSLRKEIALLRLDVKRLGTQTTRFLTSVRRIRFEALDVIKGVNNVNRKYFSGRVQSAVQGSMVGN